MPSAGFRWISANEREAHACVRGRREIASSRVGGATLIIGSNVTLFIPSAGETFGTVLRTRRVGDFLLRESRYPASRRLPIHHHAQSYFCSVISGSIEESCRGWDRIFERGSAHFHPAGEPHAGRTGAEGAICLSVVPQGRIAERIDDHSERRLIGVPDQAIRLWAGRCVASFLSRDELSDLALEAAALTLVAALLSEACPERKPRWLEQVREFIHAHRDHAWSMSELAAVAGVHPVHLARVFRRHVGTTPAAYLRRLRLQVACEALAHSNQPIVDISLAAGFSSQAHFSRAFHREIGTSPGAFRRGARGHRG
jgi:AraC family transcriptional regulator